VDFAAFERMTAAEAEEFLGHFRDIEADRMPSLVAEAREAGLTADFTVDSVAPLLLWLQRRTERVPIAADESLPEWLRTDESYIRSLFDLTSESKTLVLRGAYYLGQSFVQEWPHQLRWATGDTETALMNQPVVAGFQHELELSPLLVVENLFHRLHSRPESEGDIVKAVDKWRSFVPQ
jgi:hypothetical protein